MSQQDLIPQSMRTKEEQKEIARKGGIASGEARRAKRTYREIAQMLAEKRIDIKNPDGSVDKATYDVAVVDAQYRKAITKGDTNAARFLSELTGDLATQGTSETNIIVKSEDEARKIKDIGNLGV